MCIRDRLYLLRMRPNGQETGKRLGKHKLWDLNVDSRTAWCETCGPVKVRQYGGGRWRCSSRSAQLSYAKGLWKKHRLAILNETAYQELFEQQHGLCAICEGAPTGGHGRLCIDHDHATGQFRGLLCSKCNSAIGLLGDNPVVVDRAAAYLRKHKLQNVEKPLL